MTEAEAQEWVRTTFGAAAHALLGRLAALVTEEAARQNLIATSTIETMWRRHLVDSAQLVPLAPPTDLWVDIGTGAGFPGLVVAALRNAPMLLVEPRRRRAEFLIAAARELGLRNVKVAVSKIERVERAAAVISARAVAPVEKLLRAATGCATAGTRWLLPRGKVQPHKLAELKQRWSGEFHVKQSLTDVDSSILVLDNVRSRKARR